MEKKILHENLAKNNPIFFIASEKYFFSRNNFLENFRVLFEEKKIKKGV